MNTINQENLLDWYNTRGGKVIVKPPFGDKLTSRDIIGSPLKKRNKVTFKKVETFVESLKRRGFQKTYVQRGKECKVISKLIDLDAVKVRFTGVESVYYGDLEGKNFSKVYKL